MLMNHSLRKFLGDLVLCYLNDILILPVRKTESISVGSSRLYWK